MIYRGACHCGAVSAEYETDAAVRLRQDGCSFCSSRGVKSTSDPNGRLTLTAKTRLIRYRFGQKTADFLICGACGTYVATSMEGPRGPVGVINVVGLRIGEHHLSPGDTLVLYTDGVTESFNDAGEEFGEQRLIEALRQHRDLSPQALLASLAEEIRQFSPHQQHDDVTMVVA